ncbi:MAG: hypothetical protein GKR87_14300 [Kiritimatiellae bacterium]|nr:hypothetical protein [Kiritimatiellia bacterium]
MYDQHTRPYYKQTYANSGFNIHGHHLDTIEIELGKDLEEADKEKIRNIANTFSDHQVDGIGISRSNLVILEIAAGYYDPAVLQNQLQAEGLKVVALKHYFSGRLNEVVHPSVGKHTY